MVKGRSEGSYFYAGSGHYSDEAWSVGSADQIDFDSLRFSGHTAVFRVTSRTKAHGTWKTKGVARRASNSGAYSASVYWYDEEGNRGSERSELDLHVKVLDEKTCEVRGSWSEFHERQPFSLILTQRFHPNVGQEGVDSLEVSEIERVAQGIDMDSVPGLTQLKRLVDKTAERERKAPSNSGFTSPVAALINPRADHRPNAVLLNSYTDNGFRSAGSDQRFRGPQIKEKSLLQRIFESNTSAAIVLRRSVLFGALFLIILVIESSIAD